MSYVGKTVAIEPLLKNLARAAEKTGFSADILAEVDGFPILALSRSASPGARRIYLSAGIHGDEPAGPLALLDLLERGLSENVTWHICPALNPAGLQASTRENSAGIDLNRDYLAQSQPEIRAHAAWLDTLGPLDLALFLHEDWESSGFYIYELNPSPETFTAAQTMLEAVARCCPLDCSPVIDGHDACGGLIVPRPEDLDRPDWAEAIYLFHRHNTLNYTLESPSSLDLSIRVRALREAVVSGTATFMESGSKRADQPFDR